MIQVNGDPVAWRDGMSIQDLLRERNFIFPLLVVRVNGALVAKERYAETPIPDGADVQVIHLISGG